MAELLTHSLQRLFAAILLTCLIGVSAAPAASPAWVSVNNGNSGFVLAATGKAFIPWGFNYARDDQLRLIEDYWEKSGPDGWAKVERNFREMKRLGANVVRVHLQFARFMEAPGKPNRAALARLERLIDFAESLEIYLDITGLGTYRARDVPHWYDNLSERERWKVQAEFWAAIARVGAKHHGVFAYNLMNEPLIATQKRSPGQWTFPGELSGFRYVEYINLDPAGRASADIVRSWVRQLTSAIRKQDKRHAITVGMIWDDRVDPESMPISPTVIAPEVDFLAVHMYPKAQEIDAALDALARYRRGKPIVIEETAPMRCGANEYAEFLRRSRGTASGWLSHFWSSPEDLEKKGDISSAIMRESLKVFRAANPNPWPSKPADADRHAPAGQY